jgi:hypothetical protein
MMKIIPALIIAGVISGCASPEQAKPPCGFVAGKNVASYDVQSVRGIEIIKVYKTGRRIDPANPNIMHEAGEIYVVNRSPAWNLRANTPVGDPVFANHPRPVNIRNENTELLRNTNQAMRHLGNQMLKNREEIQKVSKENQNKKNIEPLIEQLEKEQGKIKRGLAELEK